MVLEQSDLTPQYAFIDLKAQQQQVLPEGRSLREVVDARIAAVLDHVPVHPWPE